MERPLNFEKEKNAGRLNPKSHFFRFQLTALLATIVDFAMTIFFKEVTHFHYSWAVASGSSCGAVTAFSINRFWVFKSLQTHPLQQAFRYLLVVTGSIILNTGGTYLFTETFHTPYLISKSIIALIVGFTYSYHFSKRFVFYV